MENKQNKEVNTWNPGEQKVRNKEKVHRFLHQSKPQKQDTNTIKYIIKSTVS